jgi:hypothetical protein
MVDSELLRRDPKAGQEEGSSWGELLRPLDAEAPELACCVA